MSDPASSLADKWRPFVAPLAFLGGALLGAGGGHVARAPQGDETRFLNFDVESTGSTGLGEGWSTFEGTRAGDTFAWCTQVRCTVNVLVITPDDRVIRFRAFPFRYPGAPPQRATVSINDKPVASVMIPDGENVFSFGAEKRFWRAGTNVLRFDLAYAEVPKEHVPGTDDGRRLSIAIDWLEIIRR